jgi:hypothetical protein
VLQIIVEAVAYVVHDKSFSVICNVICNVSRIPCPYCGAIFPNRPKVHDGEGWWWRCYTEDCVVRYYEPERMLVEVRGTGETISYEELWRLFKRGPEWSG